jgi:hypothetical protein
LCSLSESVWAQRAISIKPIIQGYHPYADPNNEIAPKANGTAGTFALEPGLILGYEEYLYKRALGFKLNISGSFDNANKFAAMAQLGLRLRTYTKNQYVGLCVGPSFFLRQSWIDVPGYTDNGIWNSGTKLQTKLSLFSVELEYGYHFTPMHSVSISFNQIGPRAYCFTAGYAYWPKSKKSSMRGFGGRANNY